MFILSPHGNAVVTLKITKARRVPRCVEGKHGFAALGGRALSELFTFPPAPSPDAIEWPGDPIGPSNTITRSKTRTAVHDKTIDRLTGRRDALVDPTAARSPRPGRAEPL